jgi:hypothetical protein
MEKGFACTDRVDVELGGRGWYQVRRLDFKVSLFNKKSSYALDNPGPQPEVRLLGGQSLLLPVA